MSESNNPKLDLDAKLEAEINEALEELDFESTMESAAPPDEPGGEDDSDTASSDTGDDDDQAATHASVDEHEVSTPHAAPASRQSSSASTATRPRRAGARGTSSRPRRGVRLRTHAGTVMAIRGDDVLIELGPRSQGICPLSQFPAPPEIGSQHDFLIDRVDPKDNVLILSLPGAVRKADWGTLDVGQIIEARCIGVIRGGLEMEVGGHKGFMPASHADIRHVKDVSIFLNEKLQCEVIQLDRRRNKMVLSRRKILNRERKQKVRELLDTLQPGDTVQATIVSLQPYGAFADIGGLDGLIHVSDISHDRIHHPSAAVKVGDVVQAKVLKVDASQKPPKISLGLKQLQEDPFAKRLEEIIPGAVVTGRVTKLMDFGAFVEVAPGVEGLVHISEIAWERIKTPAQILAQDQVISVKVLNVNKEERRISLSLKQTLDRPEFQPAEHGGESAAHGGGGEGSEGRGQGRGGANGRGGHGQGGRGQGQGGRGQGSGGRGQGSGGGRPSGGGRGRSGGSNMFRGMDSEGSMNAQREVDPHLKKLRAALSKKFSDNLKGGIG